MIICSIFVYNLGPQHCTVLAEPYYTPIQCCEPQPINLSFVRLVSQFIYPSVQFGKLIPLRPLVINSLYPSNGRNLNPNFLSFWFGFRRRRKRNPPERLQWTWCETGLGSTHLIPGPWCSILPWRWLEMGLVWLQYSNIVFIHGLNFIGESLGHWYYTNDFGYNPACDIDLKYSKW